MPASLLVFLLALSSCSVSLSQITSHHWAVSELLFFLKGFCSPLEPNVVSNDVPDGRHISPKSLLCTSGTKQCNAVLPTSIQVYNAMTVVVCTGFTVLE